VVVNGETVVINGRTYEFSDDGDIEAGSDVLVDISDGGTKAQGTLTITTQPTADDTMTIVSRVYTFKAVPDSDGEIGLGAAAVAQVEDFTCVGNTAAVAQIETFTTRADSSDDLDGKWFQLSDEDGTVAFWFDVDDSGTSAPSHGMDRAVEITTIATDDADTVVATKVATAVNADSKFAASEVGAVVTVTHATAGAVGNGADGDATFTAFTVTTPGTDPGLDGKWFQLSDEDGTVGVWIDSDNSGTTIPAGASALDRAIEITGVTDGNDNEEVATAVASGINGDSKFSASETAEVVTVTHATAGDVGNGADGDAGFTAFTVTTPGVDPTAHELIVAAINGTDGINAAHPQVTAAAFVGFDSVITASEPGVEGNSIATTESFTAGTNVFDAVTLGTTTAGVDVTATEAGDALVAALAADSSGVVTGVNVTGTVTLTAKTISVDGNAYTTTETMANGAFGAGTMSGGTTPLTGHIRVSITDGSAETVTLRIGAPDDSGQPFDYKLGTTQITHAAP
jgi:hypothetical protein